MFVIKRPINIEVVNRAGYHIEINESNQYDKADTSIDI